MKQKKLPTEAFTGDSAEARTLDPLIKSQLLYQLSYEIFSDKLNSGLQI